MKSERGAVDFETWDWVNPLFCGFVWGPPGERKTHYIHDKGHKASRKLMVAALEFLGRHEVDEWWAHNAKGFEGNLFVEAALIAGWKVEAALANNKPVTLTFWNPKCPKEKFILNDTMQLTANAKLKNCAEDFELPSRKFFTEEDYKVDARKWPFEKLRNGCLTDCHLVLELVERIETIVVSHGGKLRATMASTANTILRAKVKEHHPGVEWPDMSTGPHAAMNQLAEEHYHGGRTEIFHHFPDCLMDEDDINSSYPAAMLGPVPWDPIGQFDTVEAFDRVYNGEWMGLLEATVLVPKMWLPPLPWKHPDGGIFFPVGQWRGWFNSIELEYAVKECGVKILAKHGCLAYKPRALFKEFIEEMYEIKNNSQGALRETAKGFLNSSYGKIGQRPEVEKLAIFESIDAAMAFSANILRRRKRGEKINTETYQFDGFDGRCLNIIEEKWHKHAHYAAVGTITARARINWHRYAMKCKNLAYGDTDSFHSSGGLESLRSNELGAVSSKKRRFWAVYFAPKTYAMRLESGEWKFAAKGVPKDYDSFSKLILGQSVPKQRLISLKSQLRKGGRFTVIDTSRAWQGLSNKRRPHADGSTTPWDVSELEQNEHERAESPVGFLGSIPFKLPTV